jgi:coenzyme Q-binding protein COQ10
VPTFKTVRRVRYTPEQMFALVADVEHYPKFLPLCESLIVNSRQDRPEGTEVIATMGVGYKAIREVFTTRVVIRPGAREIDVTYLDGPFRRLDNRWRFIPAAPGCDIDFFIDYEFKSPFLSLLMGGLFDTAFRRFSQAFEERADVVYGTYQTPASDKPLA